MYIVKKERKESDKQADVKKLILIKMSNMYVFYASYLCLAMQLLEEMPCDTFSTNYTLKILEKIEGHALVNKEKKIYTRIT